MFFLRRASLFVTGLVFCDFFLHIFGCCEFGCHYQQTRLPGKRCFRNSRWPVI